MNRQPQRTLDGSNCLYGFGLEAMEQSGDWYYFLADGLGSTMAIVDDAGAGASTRPG